MKPLIASKKFRLSIIIHCKLILVLNVLNVVNKMIVFLLIKQDKVEIIFSTLESSNVKFLRKEILKTVVISLEEIVLKINAIVHSRYCTSLIGIETIQYVRLGWFR